MGERRERKIPKRFTKKYGEKFPIWSFSRVNSFHNCLHEYWLSRIQKLEGKENIYSVTGSCVHDSIEAYYNGEIEYGELVDRFESDFLNIEISDFKFSNDEDRNDSMREKYKECIIHFLKNHVPIKTKVITEQEIWIDVDGHVFMGYIDVVTKGEDGVYYVYDWKTSTRYTGKKIEENANQLLLYALALNQAGASLDKIKVAWNFLKYTNITYMQKNKKLKTTIGERHKWVEKIKTPLKKDLKEFYQLEDWEVDIKIDELIRLNSLDSIDKSIRDKYELSDCFVYVDVTEESLIKLKKDLADTVSEIQSRSKDEKDWQREEIKPEEEFYCNVLCGQRRNCKYYTDYLNRKNDIQQEELDVILDLDEILDL